MRIEVRKAEREAYAEARQIAKDMGDRNLRAPHHTVSPAGLIGELAIAAGGVLLLDEVEQFASFALKQLRSHLNWMHKDVRPVLFLTHECESLPGRVQEMVDALREGE